MEPQPFITSVATNSRLRLRRRDQTVARRIVETLKPAGVEPENVAASPSPKGGGRAKERTATLYADVKGLRLPGAQRGGCCYKATLHTSGRVVDHDDGDAASIGGR
jgi:hypothetical protein